MNLMNGDTLKKLERAKLMMESWKAFLSLAVFCVTTFSAGAIWLLNTNAWASDIARVETSVQQFAIEGEIRDYTSKYNDLEDQVFVIERRISSAGANPNPDDVATRARLIRRMDSIQREIDRASSKLEKVKERK